MKRGQEKDLEAFTRQWRLDRQTPDQILAGLDNDYQRFQYCHMKAEMARADWYSGQTASVLSVLGSREEQYGNMDGATRVMTGNTNWSLSRESKDLAGLDQMYTRWAQLYLASSEAKRSRSRES
jgi:hypothetical protein